MHSYKVLGVSNEHKQPPAITVQMSGADAIENLHTRSNKYLHTAVSPNKGQKLVPLRMSNQGSASGVVEMVTDAITESTKRQKRQK